MLRITHFLAVRLYLTASFTPPREIRYHAAHATDVERSSSIANQRNLTGGFSSSSFLLHLLDGLLPLTTTALKYACGC